MEKGILIPLSNDCCATALLQYVVKKHFPYTALPVEGARLPLHMANI